MNFLNFDRENFRALFRALFTILVSLWTGAYLWNVTFSKAEEVSKYAEFIIGFVLGTLIATLINFYFGGSENGIQKTPSGGDGTVVGPAVPDSVPATDEVVPGDDA